MALGTAIALGSIGAKLLGGLFGKKAAKSAAQIQMEAAQKAGDAAKQVVTDTNPQVLSTAKTAGDNALASADRAAEGVDTATKSANALLNPYADAGATAAGVLNKGIAEGGDFNRMPTQADITIDPGYAFRQQQAQQALERSAGAHGGVDNGGFTRDLVRFIGGDASQEYQNAFQRFQTSTQNRFNNVFGVANQGQTAATTQGGNLINSSVYGGNVRNQATQYAGDQNVGATNLTTGRTIDATDKSNEFSLQGANANATGTVAGSNALWNGINGAVNTAQEAFGGGTNMFNPANRWATSTTAQNMQKLPLVTQRWATPTLAVQ